MKEKAQMNREEAEALNRLAREQMKERLLRDILFDMQVCRLEGWDPLAFLVELREMLDDLMKRKE